MALVKLTSSGLEATKTSCNNLLDASFSSYLNGTEETIVLNLESTRNLSKKADDGEIDIFSAEKYFNEGVDQENQENSEPQNKHKIDDQQVVNIVSLQQKTRPLTPSVHSESSWNSRSALLQKVSRNHYHHHQPPPAKANNNQSYGKKFLARIGCNCYCKDKNSVEVDDQLSEKSFNRGKYHGKTKQNPIKTRSSESTTIGANHQDLQFKKIDNLGLGLKTDERFVIPVFDPKGGNPGVNIQLQQEEESRKSLEVFGFPITEKERSKFNLEKNIGMLTWDAIVPKAEEIDIINKGASSNGTYEDDYAESDASSDLFEIESFPSNNTVNPSLVRQGSDGMSCYAPSEVSIDWSVVTASAADFPIMSDSEDVKIPSIRTKPNNRIAHNGRDKTKRRSGILLGCNSHKAVGVVGDAYKASGKTSVELHQRNFKTHEPIMPMTRLHSESKVSRFDGGNRKHEFTTRSFASTYTGRPADFLYI